MITPNNMPEYGTVLQSGMDRVENHAEYEQWQHDIRQWKRDSLEQWHNQHGVTASRAYQNALRTVGK
jgi:hypothetical protein